MKETFVLSLSSTQTKLSGFFLNLASVLQDGSDFFHTGLVAQHAGEDDGVGRPRAPLGNFSALCDHPRHHGHLAAPRLGLRTLSRRLRIQRRLFAAGVAEIVSFICVFLTAEVGLS